MLFRAFGLRKNHPDPADLWSGAAGRGTYPPAGRPALFLPFQEDRLLPWYTAEENLTLALGSREQAQMWLEQTGLADAGALYPGELSGGMRRRVSLARALGYPSDVLVLDEPLRELDAATCQRMLELIARSRGNRLLLLVTHDLSQAEALGCTLVREPFAGHPQA